MRPLILIVAVIILLFAFLHPTNLAEPEPEQVKTVGVWPTIVADPNPAYARLAFIAALRPKARSAPTERTTMRAASASPPVITGEPSDAQFDTLAGCESGGRWDANTGNGYYGGLQFDAQTWHANGGTGLPHEHSRLEQIEIARRVWRARGWAPWPSCSRRLGWR